MVWEINRWKAPSKASLEEAKPEGEEVDVSTSGSKEDPNVGTGKDEEKNESKKHEQTTNGVTNGATPDGVEDDKGADSQDVEMQGVAASSPGPVPVAAAS